MFDSLIDSGLLNDDRILGGKYGEGTMKTDSPRDINFLLWSLIPYIIACSGEYLLKETVSFEEAATLRPDGGHNICSADVFNPNAPKPKYDNSMRKFCGCCWNSYEDLTLWQCDSEWSDKRVGEDYPSVSTQDLMLLKRWWQDTELSDAEYARLAKRGYVSILNENGYIKVVPHCVILENSEIRSELLAVGSKVKEKHWSKMTELRDRFVNSFLQKTPPHLHKALIAERKAEVAHKRTEKDAHYSLW